MKKITKICAVVAACLATIGLTGCPDVAASIGKDDFYGTWMTLDFDDTHDKEVGYYINQTPGEYYGHPYSITWNFDGKAENMFNGTGGTFWQHLVHYSSVTVDEETGAYTFGDIVRETFWYGEYAIKGNSGYSKGKLYLYYECGYEFPLSGGQVNTSDSKYVSLDTLKTWKTSDFLSRAGLNGLTDTKLVNNVETDGTTHNNFYKNNNVTIQVREVNGKKQCSDIEYFRFNLKDGSASGYTRMMATVKGTNGTSNIGGIYDQWATENYGSLTGQYKGGYKVHDSSSWSGQTTRFMGRISVTSTPDNPSWLYSNHTPNTSYFNISDSSDSTNYVDPEADVRAEE